jgi:hypothetical protein
MEYIALQRVAIHGKIYDKDTLLTDEDFAPSHVPASQYVETGLVVAVPEVVEKLIEEEKEKEPDVIAKNVKE